MTASATCPGGISAATRWRRASQRAADAGSRGYFVGKCPGRFRADAMIRVLTIAGRSTETLTLALRSASSRMAFVIRLHLCGSLAGRDVLGDCPFFG